MKPKTATRQIAFRLPADVYAEAAHMAEDELLPLGTWARRIVEREVRNNRKSTKNGNSAK